MRLEFATSQCEIDFWVGKQGAEELQLGRIAVCLEWKFLGAIRVTAFIWVDVRIGEQSEQDVGLWKTTSLYQSLGFVFCREAPGIIQQSVSQLDVLNLTSLF